MSLLLIKPDRDVWKPGEHNGTFRGNNLAFVAASAALEFWTDTAFEESVKQKSSTMTKKLQSIVRRFSPENAQSVGMGFLQGIRWSDKTIATAVSQKAFQRGVLLECCGPNDEVLKLLPPLTMSEAELTEGVDIIAEAVADVVGAHQIAV